MKKYFVTGGAGFIGSNIVHALTQRNDRVTVFDNFYTGHRENLAPHEDVIDIVEGDIRDFEALSKAMKGSDIVLHQAALPSVPRSIKDPATSNDVNITGTLNVLRAAHETGVERVVFASSSSVYGDNPVLPKHEGLAPNPISPYAVTKLAAEKYCVVFARTYGLHTVALRYFNVFGPRQDPNSQYAAVIPKFINAILDGERPVIFGDGKQSRDFTFVENVVMGNLLAATGNCPAGSVMNCACQGSVTLNELVASINRILGKDIHARYDDPRSGDIKHSFASIETARSLLGYEPKVDFQAGLEKTVDWYVQRRNG